MGINIVDERIGFYGEFLNNIKNNNIKEPDYDLVDQLVEKYQAGDQDAAEELINQLSPYMIKFFKIIRLGVIDLNDRDSRRFISLFIDDYGARDKLKKKFQSRDARNEAYQAALMVQSMCSQIPAEDIVQELIVILLTLAKRFIKHRKKVNFCGYLYNGFRFELARRIKIITVDPLTHRTDFNVSFDDGEYISDEDLIDENELAFCNEPIMELEEDLGNSCANRAPGVDQVIEEPVRSGCACLIGELTSQNHLHGSRDLLRIAFILKYRLSLGPIFPDSIIHGGLCGWHHHTGTVDSSLIQEISCW
jgi:hypothetical protein